jgi:hypothetical protein
MNTNVQKMNSMIPAMNATPSAESTAYMGGPVLWFSILLVVFVVIFSVYHETILAGLESTYRSIASFFSGEKPAPPPPMPPDPPQEDSLDEPSNMVEKILPPAKDVFSVSKNNYTYYDAAPLCKALGAELATYEDVKQAWKKGADWCNYGWVKGQMAVYPTQESTYEELQQGPEDQRAACGKPGLNGGYFDNPELKFGVSCVGTRPSQSQHDATSVTSGSTRPLTSSGLEFEKKVQQFKEDSEHLGILPFNKEKWGSY